MFYGASLPARLQRRYGRPESPHPPLCASCPKRSIQRKCSAKAFWHFYKYLIFRHLRFCGVKDQVDAVLVTDDGPIYGRDVIEKMYTDLFKQVHFSNHIGKPDQYAPHIIGTAGNEMWWNGEWTTTIKGENFGPVETKGYWTSIVVREGSDWKDRMQIFNVTPTPTPDNKMAS